jgi:ABC-type glycerol-3-phosphate transport system permease component
MDDVARLAGVSHQIVSRVLNEHVRVAPETRARVLAAIHTLLIWVAPVLIFYAFMSRIIRTGMSAGSFR